MVPSGETPGKTFCGILQNKTKNLHNAWHETQRKWCRGSLLITSWCHRELNVAKPQFRQKNNSFCIPSGVRLLMNCNTWSSRKHPRGVIMPVCASPTTAFWYASLASWSACLPSTDDTKELRMLVAATTIRCSTNPRSAALLLPGCFSASYSSMPMYCLARLMARSDFFTLCSNL